MSSNDARQNKKTRHGENTGQYTIKADAKPKSDETRHGKARQDKIRHDKITKDKARQNKTKQDQDKTRQEKKGKPQD